MPRQRKLPAGMWKRGSVYYARFSAHGRIVRKRLSTDFGVACELLNDLKSRADRGDYESNRLSSPHVSDVPLSSVIDDLPSPPEWADGYVYAIEACGLDKIKFGFSADPDSRAAGLQTACPVGTAVLGVRYGTKDTEARIHQVLRDFHVRGEWYFWASPVREFVARNFLSPSAECAGVPWKAGSPVLTTPPEGRF